MRAFKITYQILTDDENYYVEFHHHVAKQWGVIIRTSNKTIKDYITNHKPSEKLALELLEEAIA